MFFRLYTLLSCLLCLTYNIDAQPYSFTHYQIEAGLSSNTVFNIVQDGKGFLWFGTRNGICRFDGYAFKTFFPDSAVERRSNTISCSTTDPAGTIWIGTSTGLYRYDSKTEQFLPFLEALGAVKTIFFDGGGQLWVCADYSIYRYNFKTGQLRNFIPGRRIECNSMQEARGYIWIGDAGEGLYRLDPQSGRFDLFDIYAHSPQKVEKRVNKLLLDSSGGLLIGSNQGLKRFDFSKSDYVDLLVRHHNGDMMQIRDIVRKNKDEFWLATELGIYIFNRHRNSFEHIVREEVNNYNLSDNSVYALYLDHEKGIWVGTYHGGVSYYNDHGEGRFRKYAPDNTSKSISGNIVKQICGDPDGHIWIGTEDAGLNKLDPVSGKIEQFRPDGSPGSIAALNIQGLIAVNNRLWIGTYFHGIDVLDLGTESVVKHYDAGKRNGQFLNDFVISFLYTKDKDLLIGTQHSLYKYDRIKDSFSIQMPRDMQTNISVAYLLEDTKGTIWIATLAEGLYSFDPRTGHYDHYAYERPGASRLPVSDQINAVFEDHNHKIWVATNGGGLCYVIPDTKKLKRFNVDRDFSDNFIFSILEDARGNLWISSSEGLLMLDATRRGFLRYTVADGLPTNQFNYNSGYKSRDGNFYFGTYKGLVVFNPADFKVMDFVPPVYITSLHVGEKEIVPGGTDKILQKSILLTDTLILPYNHSSFSIEFACLNFASPRATTYSYILEGLEQNWTHLSSLRRAYYTKVRPGTYVFRVKASGKAFGSMPGKRLIIIITPPLWATSGAYVLYLLTLAGLVFYLLKLYYKRLQKRKEQEIYNAKIEFFTNIAHEIKTPLTLIRLPVENINEMAESGTPLKKNVEMLEKNVNRLSTLVDQLTDFRRTEANGFLLDLKPVNIGTLLTELFGNFKRLANKKGLSYDLTVPENNTFVNIDSEAVSKVLSNLLSNAVKYSKGEVSVRLETYTKKEEERIRIVFENDGPLIPEEFRQKVFDPFFRVPRASGQSGSGIGLALAKFLTELHKGQLYLSVSSQRNVFILELPVVKQPS